MDATFRSKVRDRVLAATPDAHRRLGLEVHSQRPAGDLMREPDVTLTDYALSVECALFAFTLARIPTDQIAFRFAAGGFFLALGLSAATGGTVHGYCSSADSGTCATLWMLTLQAIGLASASLWVAGAMLFSERVGRALALLAIPLLMIYGSAVLLVTQAFWIAFTAYLPAMLLLALGFVAARAQLPPTSRLLGVSGVAVSLASCMVQYLKIGLHPVYVSHNALAHVIQGIAMALLLVALRSAVSRPRTP
jgi:hypothetical protein